MGNYQLPIIPYPPINTVPTATTVPTGISAGSLQVLAVSPLRAAPLPLMSTVALPRIICPRLLGGAWNGPPCGMWGGVLVAVLFRVAAAMPMILTSLLRLPSRMPLNGCGIGVGTGPPGDGIMMMWVSTPTIWSPCLAAGWPMSVQLNRRALDLDAAVGLDVHARAGFERHAAVGLEGHIRLGFDLDLAFRRKLHVAV